MKAVRSKSVDRHLISAVWYDSPPYLVKSFFLIFKDFLVIYLR